MQSIFAYILSVLVVEVIFLGLDKPCLKPQERTRTLSESSDYCTDIIFLKSFDFFFKLVVGGVYHSLRTPNPALKGCIE